MDEVHRRHSYLNRMSSPKGKATDVPPNKQLTHKAFSINDVFLVAPEGKAIGVPSNDQYHIYKQLGTNNLYLSCVNRYGCNTQNHSIFTIKTQIYRQLALRCSPVNHLFQVRKRALQGNPLLDQ